MSEFSIQSVTDGKLCLHFLPLGWKILSMMEIFDFQHPENVNIFMMIKNCSLFRQYPNTLPALAGSS